MKKSCWILVIITVLLIVLILFFYPKKNNIWDDTFTAQVAKQYKNMDRTCIGFNRMKPGLSRSDTQVQLCYGLPINCIYTCKKVIAETWQDISCDISK